MSLKDKAEIEDLKRRVADLEAENRQFKERLEQLSGQMKKPARNAKTN